MQASSSVTLRLPATEYTIREGVDYLIDDRKQLPLRIVDNLGYGHSGNVEKVEDPSTRKLLKGHRHVIQVFATYVSKDQVGLILQPVADEGDLGRFLQNYRESADNRLNSRAFRVLERSFGCLLNGLAFMHKQKIRHKDIRPRNILVHQGRVMYTDFGYSLDSSSIGHSTTQGKPGPFTLKYAAPEVIDYEPRNSLSDIYSLGCVFLEILAALTNFDVETEQRYSEVMEKFLHDFLLIAIPSPYHFIVDIIASMTSVDPTKRPTAMKLYGEFPMHLGFFCETCLCESEWYFPRRWSDEYQRFYQLAYIGGEWTFPKWLETAPCTNQPRIPGNTLIHNN